MGAAPITRNERFPWDVGQFALDVGAPSLVAVGENFFQENQIAAEIRAGREPGGLTLSAHPF